jgi:hypothetical protein
VLSYVWGTHPQTEELVTPDGILQITPSLSKALRGLRHKQHPIMLWVDAICINQDDNEEKADQIRLLPRIFQNATSTYAFLEGDEESDAAIEMLMQLRAKAAHEGLLQRDTASTSSNALDSKDYSESETTGDDATETGDASRSHNGQLSRDWPRNLPRVSESWAHRRTPCLNDAIWSSVKNLSDLPWFRRVWIIQEIVAATHVRIVCGKWVINWQDLHSAVEVIDHEVQLSDIDLSNLKSSWEPFLSLAAHREWEANRYRWSLIMLLENFRYVQSTLCRDRFFALLGLASDGDEEEFEPDYKSPIESVVLKFAQVFVRQGRGMQLLYRAGLNHWSDRFPS